MSVNSSNPLTQLILVMLVSLLLFSMLNGQSTDKYLKKLPQPTGTLYFIKPLKWQEIGGTKQLEADFTFKFEQVVDTVLVTLNSSIFSKKPINRIQSFQIRGLSDDQLVANTLYVQQNKGKWEARVQVTFPMKTFLEWLPNAGDEILQINSASTNLKFQPSKKWKKAIESILPVIQFDIEKTR